GIPAGSTITNVQLDLHVSMVANATPRTLELHHVTADWSEGASNAGTPGATGAPSTSGDATWVHRFFNTMLWTTPGGDFAASIVAAQTVTATGPCTFLTNASMVAEAQSWLDVPSTNYGWLVKGDESTSGTAVRYDTREN